MMGEPGGDSFPNEWVDEEELPLEDERDEVGRALGVDWTGGLEEEEEGEDELPVAWLIEINNGASPPPLLRIDVGSEVDTFPLGRCDIDEAYTRWLNGEITVILLHDVIRMRRKSEQVYEWLESSGGDEQWDLYRCEAAIPTRAITRFAAIYEWDGPEPDDENEETDYL